jgi:hypothetical protein
MLKDNKLKELGKTEYDGSKVHPQTLKHMKNQNSKLHLGHYELSVQFYQYYTVVAETLHQYL